MKSICKTAGILCILICISSALTSCSNNDKSAFRMTKLDKEFDSYAHKAAEDFLVKEAKEVTWTDVITGDLTYLYSFHDIVHDKYKVKYISKFDEADEPKDEWIIITVYLTSNKNVEEAEGSYCDAKAYEHIISHEYGEESFKGIDWKNVNIE